MRRLLLTAAMIAALTFPAQGDVILADAPYAVAEEKAEPGVKLEDIGEYTLTFYCSCRRCNGKWGDIDGFGEKLAWGTVAVDPKVIPLRTKLVIDGYDMVFEARDTGSGVGGKHIDVYVPVSHAEAARMGQQKNVKVWRLTNVNQ